MTRAPRALRRSRRGFTLVELLVAMTAGLTVAAAAMVLSKNATNFFQHEARISAAQLSLTLGMNRITQDLQRAALLATPNIQRDAQNQVLCGDPTQYPAGMQQLAGIQLTASGAPAALQQSTDNGFTPDILVVGGSLSTTEQFTVRSIDPDASAPDIILRLEDDDAMRRTRARALAGAGEDVTALFRTGRFVRIVDQAYKHEWGVISAVSEGPSGDPYVDVRVQGNPVTVPTTGLCGLYGHETGALVSVVYRVRYELASMQADMNYKGLTAPVSAAMTGDALRTELVRSELDETDTPMAANTAVPPEVVSEYAVDLKFGLETATWDATTKTYATLRYPVGDPGDPAILAIAGPVGAGVGTPETIRAVQVRLSTRTRAPDRATDLDIDLGQQPDGRRARFWLKDVASPQQFARMRTLYSDVFLPNQAGVQ